jgi:hypothetical protein
MVQRPMVVGTMAASSMVVGTMAVSSMAAKVAVAMRGMMGPR